MSNRVLLLAALASGETRLYELLASDDPRVMQDALRALGIALRQEGGATVVTGAAALFRSRRPSCFSATPAPRSGR